MSFVLQTLPIFLSAIPVVDTYGHVISFTAMILMFVVVIINIDKKDLVSCFRSPYELTRNGF